jgi:hypothetical protein
MDENNLSKTSYATEQLVLNVVYHGKVASQVAKDIHRSRGGWVFQRLKRYEMRKIYIEGLKDKPKSGRRSRINEKTEYRINLF